MTKECFVLKVRLQVSTYLTGREGMGKVGAVSSAERYVGANG